ncbi:MAG: hypothetical protein ACM3NH_01285 [Candidatus Saccharibacteria bacterium]
MNAKSYLERLQQLPLSTRVKILWVTVVVIAAGLVALWFINLKSQISRLDTDNLLPGLNNSVVAQKHVTAEWAETKDDKLRVYFKVTNETNDILNFPQLSEIKLQTEDKEISADNVTDRQGKPFVKRVLSKTENYGVLIFPKIDAEQASLLLDQLYFEMKPSELFSEKVDLNFNDLNQAPELRK